MLVPWFCSLVVYSHQLDAGVTSGGPILSPILVTTFINDLDDEATSTQGPGGHQVNDQ